MPDTIVVAIVATVPAILTAIVGFVTAWRARHKRQSDVRYVDEQTDKLREEVRLLRLEHDQVVEKRLIELEHNRLECSQKLAEMEAERIIDRAYIRTAQALQKSLEGDMADLRQQLKKMAGENETLRQRITALQKENDVLRRQLAELRRTVNDTGELSSKKHNLPKD